MPILPVKFNQGTVTSRPRDSLEPGECQVTTGGYYRPGDTDRLWKRGGRTLFGTVTALTNVIGLVFAAFDTGTDLLLALAGTTIKKATAGLTGTFSSLITGLSASTTTLSGVSVADKWYLATGYDRNRVVEDDGTARLMGMEAPIVPLTAAASSVAATTLRPNAETNGAGGAAFTSPTLARDSSESTFAYANLAVTGTPKTCTWTWAAAAATSRQLTVIWGLSPYTGQFTPVGPIGNEAATFDGGFDVSVRIEISVDGGANFTDLVRVRHLTQVNYFRHFATTTVGVNLNLVQIRATLTYNTGTKTATFRIFDLRAQIGTSVAAFTTTSDLTYGYTEYDELRGLESPISPLVAVGLTAQNIVTLSGFTTVVNSNATKFRIYRNYQGGAIPVTLGLLDSIPITETFYIDTFERFAYDVPPIPLYRLLTVTVDQATLRFALDSPPPACSHLNVFRGSIVGVRKDKPRSLVYSAAGLPESWPECNVIENFPMPEHDELVATATVGDTLLIGAKDLMLTLRDLPRVLLGTFDASKAEPLRGQPGLIHQYAICTYSVEGEARCAWVSQYGVHETNGLEARRISGDIDWAGMGLNVIAPVVLLVWDPENLILILKLASPDDGLNMILFHMAPEHQKANGLPKWTGRHYGYAGSMVVGRLGGAGIVSRQVIWSGHGIDGKVYCENRSGLDESDTVHGYLDNSYPVNSFPMIVKPGRLYADRETFGLYRGSLRHSAWGVGQSLKLDGSFGRDAGTTQTLPQKTVPLVTEKGEETLIARSGDWAEFTLTHTGDTGSTDLGNIGALTDFRCDIRKMGASGRTA